MGSDQYRGGIATRARVVFFSILGVAFAIIALACLSMAVWNLIEILFIAAWLTFRAGLLVVCAFVDALIAMALFAHVSRPSGSQFWPRHRGKGTKPPKIVDGTIEVWEKGTSV